MTSHDKHNISLPEKGLPLMEKNSQIAPNDTVVAKREDRRRHPARRLFLAFLICSSMLFVLASVHSPSFRQRFSCHNGMMGNVKLGVAGEDEAQPSTLTAMMEKEGPQASNESFDLSVPNQLEENHQEGGDVYHAAAAPKATKLRLLRRETNSSSVAPESSATARTADPDPTSTPTASSSEPSSTAESPTSSASPTPSSPTSSTFKTSTTTPTTSPQTSTTKVPDPTTSSSSSSSTPEPPNTGVNVTPSKTSSVESTSSVTSSSTSSRGQATTTTASVDDEDDGDGDGDDVTHDTTIYTTRPANPTAPPPTTPKVIIETSTRTSNGQVVIVESTFTVQPSITQPASVTDPARPPASLQNSATRQEGGGMVLARLMAGAVMVVLLY